MADRIEQNTSPDIPNPLRAETILDLRAAQKVVATTHCSPEEYNQCTDIFETERELCKEEAKINL
jgi:hypothetical protein